MRRRLRESPASAREAFDALPRPHRIVFASRRLEAEVAESGFTGFFEGPYGVLRSDALEALRAIGAEEHAGILERAMGSRGLWLASRRREALARATAAFHALEDRAPLVVHRARYIEREGRTFEGMDGPGQA